MADGEEREEYDIVSTTDWGSSVIGAFSTEEEGLRELETLTSGLVNTEGTNVTSLALWHFRFYSSGGIDGRRIAENDIVAMRQMNGKNT